MDYDHYAKGRDAEIAEMLSFHFLNDCYLFDPNEVLKKDGTPYLVFTPYYRACKALYTQFYALEYKRGKQSLANFDYNVFLSIQGHTQKPLHVRIESIGFEPLHVTILEPEKALKIFTCKVDAYDEKRDFLDADATSHLSSYLRFGTISIREVVRFLVTLKQQGHTTEPFFRQLIFREFYAYLLYHFPRLAWENYKYAPPISNDAEAYERFILAQTGYPLIDAAVSELLSTGLMHNRARMVVGSFFTKHLMLPWQKGEAFFAKHLLDYDASANVLSWQWCAGTGIDPQPYFRIFNPYRQSMKFDKEARYIKRYLPLLKDIPASYLHKEAYLMHHDIKGYPKPIIGHESARKRFLLSFTS